MAIPTTRVQFTDYCLRRLGSQVIQINASPDQIDDRVDQAITYFQEWHDEATQKMYYSYQVQQADITNRYLTLPANIIGVNNIFPIGMNLSSNSMFNIRYQLLLNDIANISSMQLGPYVQIFQNIDLIEQVLIGQTPIVFTKYLNRVDILTDWLNINVNDYLCLECYATIDPNTHSNMWSNRWLQSYATALIQKQWAQNISKFKSLSLVGGQQFNGDQLLRDAQAEINKLEEECKSAYNIITSLYVG